jgi:hypothetical protein
MLFVSRKPEYETVVRPDIPGQRVNQYGMTENFEHRPALVVRFIPKQLTPAQRIRADLEFRRINPTSPYGATPYQDDGVMGSQFAEYIDDAEPFKGYNPSFMLGKFDTATDIIYAGQPEAQTEEGKAELRKMVETHLQHLDSSLNVDYILLDGVTLEKPWPNYPLDGQGRHNAIAAAVKTLGLDPRVVIEFEQSQDKPGVGVISAMEALIGEFDETKKEDDALSASIPA